MCMYVVYHICLSKHTHPIWVLCEQIYTHIKGILILYMHIDISLYNGV